MKIAIANDHSASSRAEDIIKEHLESKGYEY